MHIGANGEHGVLPPVPEGTEIELNPTSEYLPPTVGQITEQIEDVREEVR